MTTFNANRNLRLIYIYRMFASAFLVIPVIVPFFQQNGMSQAEIFLAQSAFAATVLLLEVPSGYVADRWGRRQSLLLGAIFWTLGFVVYSFSYGFSHILVAEVILGIGVSFISGADTALVYDSLLAAGRKNEYRSYEAKRLGFIGAAEAAASLAGGWIAVEYGLRATVIGDAILAAPTILIAWLLVEPPRHVAKERNAFRDVLRVSKYALHGHQEIKWLIIYGAIIGTSTHTMVWLIQPYFQQVGIPLGWFGILWAALLASMLLFSPLAVRYERWLGKRRAFASFVVIAAATYLLISFVSIWLIPVMLGFYFIRSVYTPILRDYVNGLVASDIRATVLSVQSLGQRLLYIGAGPLIGWVMDIWSLQTALLFSAVFYGVLGTFAVIMMKRAKLL